MNLVGRFEKVSFEEYQRANEDVNMTEEELRAEYDAIQLPARATMGSAGYDFFLPRDITVKPGVLNRVVQTGIRAEIDPDWTLMLFPRSGLGFRYGLGLANTVGIIDADYAGAANEGHIAARLTTMEEIEMKAGDRFMQGVFVQVGISWPDRIQNKTSRIGGFGSTGV